MDFAGQTKKEFFLLVKTWEMEFQAVRRKSVKTGLAKGQDRTMGMLTSGCGHVGAAV